MKILIFKVTIIFLPIFVFGCAAMFVPETSDPDKKIDYAFDLVQHQGRPLPAESLIREAIEICKSTNNEKILMKAYWTYGVFFTSDAVGNLGGLYEKNGFLEKSVKYADRFDGAITYYEKVESIAQDLNDDNYLAMILFNKAECNLSNGSIEKACPSFRKSLDLNKKYHLSNPDVQFYLPGIGYRDFKEYEKLFIEYMSYKGCG
jgi:tetratricopeptide (TPR) repeat protein